MLRTGQGTPFDQEHKFLHARKVYWIRPSDLEDIGAMPSNMDEPRSTSASEITRKGQAWLMLCLADFPDETGAPGASLWLPLQSKGDAEIAEAEKCGYDPGPKKWRDYSSQYWLKGTTWFLGRSGSPFDPKCLKQPVGRRYISASGLREVRKKIRVISVPKGWLGALNDDDISGYISGQVIFSRNKTFRVSHKENYGKGSGRFRAGIARLPRIRLRPVPRPAAE